MGATEAGKSKSRPSLKEAELHGMTVSTLAYVCNPSGSGDLNDQVRSVLDDEALERNSKLVLICLLVSDRSPMTEKQIADAIHVLKPWDVQSSLSFLTAYAYVDCVSV